MPPPAAPAAPVEEAPGTRSSRAKAGEAQKATSHHRDIQVDNEIHICI